LLLLPSKKGIHKLLVGKHADVTVSWEGKRLFPEWKRRKELNRNAKLEGPLKGPAGVVHAEEAEEDALESRL
jgi:hypothetical protein